MKVSIATLGCRVNIYDTELMMSALKKNEFEIVSFDEYADVYCINTCTVTNNGDKKSRQYISKCKKINPNAIITMVGCYPQVSKEEVANIEDVDIILGNRYKSQLPYYINLFLQNREKIVKVDDNLIKNITFEEGNLENLQERHRAFIKVQDGCNKFCSYCIIPYARGGVCSKDPRKVYEEVKSLVSNGYKEVVLSGINTTSYGVDLSDNINMIDLIEILSEIDGLERIRVGSVDPEFFNYEIISRMKNIKKLMPHFHLSLQSGSDSVLKRMRRRYDTVKYEEVVNQFRELINDVSITTDIIVGFPGETDEEFKETFDFLSKIKLQDVHVFKYSKRSGTLACNMSGQVDNQIKDIRSKEIIKLNSICKKEFLEKYVGKQEKVLYCTLDKNGVYGYTENYNKVYLNKGEKYLGNIVSTYIKDHNGEFLLGEVSMHKEEK